MFRLRQFFFLMKEFFGQINAQYMHSAINDLKVGMTSLLIFHFQCREVIVCKLGKENRKYTTFFKGRDLFANYLIQ